MRNRFIAVVLSLAALVGSAWDRASACNLTVRDFDDPEVFEALDVLWTGNHEERLMTALSTEYLFGALDDPAPEERESVEQLLASLTAWFESENDPWILDRAARGLAEIEASTLDGLFRRLLRHPSPNVRLRAIYHLKDSEAEDLIPVFERMLRTESRPWIRAELLEALDWQDAEGFLERRLSWMKSEDLELARTVTELAGSHRPAGALPALLRQARQGHPLVRSAALRALAGWPQSLDALEVLTAEADGDEISLRFDALTSLASFPYPEAEEVLRRRARSEDAPTCEVAAATVGLAKHGEKEGEQSEDATDLELHREKGCEPWSVIGYVTPPGSMSTVRCWLGPGLTGDPEEYSRIPANTEIAVYDYFELDDETWIELMSLDGWIPLDQVTEEKMYAESDDIEYELDLPITQLATPFGQRLINHDLLEFIDPHEGVVGVALRFDGEGAFDHLLESYEPGDSPLHRTIRFVLMVQATSDDADDSFRERALSVFPSLGPVEEFLVRTQPE